MKKRIGIIVLTLVSMFGFAQKEGIVLNMQTSKPIPFAAVYYVDIGTGTITDSLGRFSYSEGLPQKLTLKVSALGFSDLVIERSLSNNSIDTCFLEPSHLQLEEIIVSSPSGKIRNQTITNIETRKLSELNLIQANSLGEAITSIPNVYQSTTGSGISKPVIRGLAGNRIVTYLNGLRIENQQWGGDHGMGVDELGIGSVEVIKGPASLLYGADALGGVIYFVDEPYENQNAFSASYQSKFNSNTMGLSNSIGLKSAKKNVRANIYLSSSNNADYQLPNGNFAANSRYKNQNAKVALGFNRKNWVTNLRYVYLKNRIALPGHTHETDLSLVTFETPNQNRTTSVPAQDITNHYISLENKLYLNKGELVSYLGYTSNQLTEFEEKLTIPGIDMVLTNIPYNLYYKTKLGGLLRATVGVQGMFQDNQNLLSATEVLIPNAKSMDNGAYVLLNTDLSGNWALEAGARLDNRYIKTENGLSGSYTGFNYSFGFVRGTKSSTLRGNVSSGFRAPHTSELLANGVHHGTSTYDIGNSNLTNETATQVDISYEIHSEHFEFIFNPFYNRISNFIYRNPQDYFVGEYQVYAYEQAAKAEILGGSTGFHYHPHFADNLHLESSYSYLLAQDVNAKPIPAMPQNRLVTSLKYEFHNESKLQLQNVVLQHTMLFDQNRVAVTESRTDGAHLLNIGANILLDIKTPIVFSIGAINLLNTQYIDHLSRLKPLGLYNPGRNIYASIKIKLNKTKN